MKKYLIIADVVLVVILAGLAFYGWTHGRSMEEKWKTAEANVKAYCSELKTSKDKNTALQLSVEQLTYFNDSVLSALNETRQELKVKDKNLKALQQIASSFSKRDTIRIPGDTIFKEPTLNLDTIIGDRWYTVRLGLQYPSTIAVEPHLQSEKHVVVSAKKETVNPPKKIFFLRWFQKKHTIIHIDVVEKNPYIKSANSKYVEIIK